LEWLFDSVKGNKDIRLFTDAMVNPLSSNSISEIIGEIIKINPKEKVLHIGSRDVVSKADIGKMVIKRFKNYTGKVSYVSMDESSQVASRPKQIWLNTDHIQKSHNIVMPTVESEINKIFENVKDIN
jgi:dTDP-4-dehydrorhamnose reductase